MRFGAALAYTTAVTPITVDDLAAIMARPETGLLETKRPKKRPRPSATGNKQRGGSSAKSRGRGAARRSGGRGAAGHS